MWMILVFIVFYVVISAWDVVRVNGLFERVVNSGRTSGEHDGQPEWLVRRLEEQAATAVTPTGSDRS
jgi:hypothetical protein